MISLMVLGIFLPYHYINMNREGVINKLIMVGSGPLKYLFLSIGILVRILEYSPEIDEEVCSLKFIPEQKLSLSKSSSAMLPSL